MQISTWLKSSENKLKIANILTSRLDSIILLEDTMGKDRAWLLAHPEYELNMKQIEILNNQIQRRFQHEPIAYIRCKSEFYGREFKVNKHTLEPRPETETIIEMLKGLALTKPLTIVDIGTGTGCLAITAKLEFPDCRVVATDIDSKCIQTSRKNAEHYKTSIEFRQGNLLEPFRNDLSEEWLIIANLPYVPDDHVINKAATFEPKHAIFGGPDGLDLYRIMFQQIDGINNKPIYILTESLPFQHTKLSTIARKSGYKQIKETDFSQCFKRTKMNLSHSHGDIQRYPE